MNVDNGPQRIVVLCTIGAGVDVVLELYRRGLRPAALIGLDPEHANLEKVSGWIDVDPVADRLGAKAVQVRTYGLTAAEDREKITALRPDLVLVTGWQRLVPEWLIELAPYGVLGAHGSPDGIQAGRGRSPQNWALLLGCHNFHLSLFRITPGIDDGPVLSARTFSYLDRDDIQVSHFRASLAMADMIDEVLSDPARLRGGEPQGSGAAYYPQRMPEDGWVDWMLPADQIMRHCQALTRPYPGLRTQAGEAAIRIWRCQPFDDDVSSPPGTISSCFVEGDFLVHTSGGRLLIRDWSASANWSPVPGAVLQARTWASQLELVTQRHRDKYPDLPLTTRLAGLVGPPPDLQTR